MDQKRISCSSVFDKLPPLSTKYPWFVAQNLKTKEEDNYIENQIFYTLHNPQFHYSCQIPELLGRQIRASFHGWMILSKHPIWFLLNPLTSKLITLPPLRNTQENYDCCLSSPPDNPGSIFMLITNEKPTITFCRLDRKRKKLRWTEMSYAKQLRSITHEDEDCFLENITCCNGKVYALHSHVRECDDLVIEVRIVVKQKEVVINLLPFLEAPSISSHRYTRIKSSFTKSSFNTIELIKGNCRELFCVSIAYENDTKEIVDMHLYKLDITRMTWKEMEDLQDAVFFIELASDCSIFYNEEIATELGGYVHILEETGKLLYSYNIKDRTMSLSLMASFVRSNDVSSWAMLECRYEGGHGGSEQAKNDNNTEMVVKVVADDEVKYNSTDDEYSHLLNLPFHMLRTVMEFCVGVEYMKLRATCKNCQLASPPIQWSNKTLSRRSHTYSLLSPWLMVLNIHQGTITFIDPVFGDKYFISIPKELIDYSRICCSKYGWLLMHKEVGFLVFYNPFTRDIIELPRVTYFESCCFSAPPTSPDCIVVGFTTKMQCLIHFVDREPLKWCTLGLNFGGDDPYSFRFPTFHDQNIYALYNEDGLDVFRRLGGVFHSYEHGKVKPPKISCGSSMQYFLAECDKHVLLVIMGKFGESIEVFKLNDSGREWEKIDCLGKHSIYICDAACVCVEAKTPQMENNIYFSRLHPDNGKIVFYSLETCMYHTSHDKNIDENLGDLLRTAQHSNPHTWIEPNDALLLPTKPNHHSISELSGETRNYFLLFSLRLVQGNEM